MSDILPAAGLTVGAAIAVGGLASAMARDARIAVLVLLGAWFALVLAIGATGALGLAVRLPVVALVWAYFALPSETATMVKTSQTRPARKDET